MNVEHSATSLLHRSDPPYRTLRIPSQAAHEPQSKFSPQRRGAVFCDGWRERQPMRPAKAVKMSAPFFGDARCIVGA